MGNILICNNSRSRRMLDLEPEADYLGRVCGGDFQISSSIDGVLQNITQQQLEQARLIIATAIITLALRWVFSVIKAMLKYMRNFRVNLTLSLFNIMVWLPCGRNYLRKEQKKAQEDFTQRVKSKRKNQVYRLPDQPWRDETIMNRIRQGKDEAEKFYKNGGKLSGGVYTSNKDHWDFISDAMRENIESNPLHVVEFNNIGQLEAEIIRMTLNLFNAPQDSCGLTTSGGTESIMLAMLAYREWGKKKGITSPNIIAPITAHAAFDKACFYFGMELRKIPLRNDQTADLDLIQSNIDKNTVCIVASAPEYPFGGYDPVPEIAALAQKYGTNCHSDCCLGSYINPFTEEAGFKVACVYDFRLEGVTSLSCDPHKFCYGPKGCSVIMFRTKELRRLSFCTVPTWPGGMYVTPTIAGSRSGAIITGTWAALMRMGRQGLLDKAKTLLTAAKHMREDIKKISELTLVSDHDTICVAFTSKQVNCVALNDLMQKKHRWSLNAIQLPLSSHLVVTDANAHHWKEFAPALRDCIDFLMKNPEENNRGDAAYYGMTEKIPNKGVIGEFILYYLEAVLDAL